MLSGKDANSAFVSSSRAADLQIEASGHRAPHLLARALAAPTASFGRGKNIIAVIDRRTLGREVLTRAIRLAGGCRSISAFSDIDEWLIGGQLDLRAQPYWLCERQ